MTGPSFRAERSTEPESLVHTRLAAAVSTAITAKGLQAAIDAALAAK